MTAKGQAPHTLVEHSLCVLDAEVSLQPGTLHNVGYQFTDKHRNRKRATANVACPFGLSANDELYLYGLLALTFSQPEPSCDFYATPHWCLRQLGIVGPEAEQGKRYTIFREAIRRLAGVVYENDRFYDPIRSEHRDVAFGLLKYSLPIDPSSSRAWHFVWDQQFFRFCEATAGSFCFDMQLYRSLDYSSRRLFLLLQKIFWRNDHSPAFDIRRLAVNTLGFSDQLATKEIKQKLIRVAQRLLDAQVIQLPLGADTIRDLFAKQTKGVHVVRFQRGHYFESKHTFRSLQVDSPLADPLASIGFQPPAIRKILRTYKPHLVQQWSDITLAAVERGIVRQSPQAYFMHYIREANAKRTTPPDWWHEYRRQEHKAVDRKPSIEGSDEEFDEFLRTEAHQAFNRVCERLFRKLREAGQSDIDARKTAEYTARLHLRKQFLQAHPEADASRPTRLADLIPQRQQTEVD